MNERVERRISPSRTAIDVTSPQRARTHTLSHTHTHTHTHSHTHTHPNSESHKQTFIIGCCWCSRTIPSRSLDCGNSISLRARNLLTESRKQTADNLRRRSRADFCLSISLSKRRRLRRTALYREVLLLALKDDIQSITWGPHCSH